MEIRGDFLSGLIGALIGGSATLLGSWWQHHLENRRIKSENSDSINATLQAIKAELGGLRERYNQFIGYQLEGTNDETPFLFYFHATEDYFTIYTQSSSLIGQIPDESLRNKIIAVYINMKGLLDTYKINNRMLEKYDYYHNLFLETKLIIYEQQEMAYYTSLLNYLPSIKEGHRLAVDLSNQLIDDITNYLDSQCASSKNRYSFCLSTR
jgi:hypothetical protein